MSHPLFVLLVAVMALGSSGIAQLPFPEPDKLRVERAQARSHLHDAQSLQKRLLEARIAHDLGLPFDGQDSLFEVADIVREEALSHQARILRGHEQRMAKTLEQYRRTKQLVEQLQSNKAEQPQTRAEQGEWRTVPAPVDEMPRPANSLVDLAGPGTVGSNPPAQPMGEVAGPAPDPVRVVSNLAPIQAQIHGSTNQGVVARALFKAAQALMDRADQMERQQQAEAAAQLDQQARERLERAIKELGDSVKKKKPAYVDLFYLGKCRELMFRIDERRAGLSPQADARQYQRREQAVRDPFVAIAARDVVLVEGNEKLGTWGRAAQSAMEHFRWMNLNASWRPKTDLDAIVWPGMTDR